MSVVVVNVLTVPAGSGAVLEERFAGRAGQVERAPGFEGFSLLRPVEGTDQYLVWTRWRSREDFQAWMASQAFTAGHGGAGSAPGGPPGGGPAGGGAPAAGGPSGRGGPPVSTASQVWIFEVAQDATPQG